MKIFVTGATGMIGSAVVSELLNANHQVLGLTRSDKGAQALIAMGAEVHRGELTDLESLTSGAAMSDGAIHLAYDHNFSDFWSALQTDRRAIEAMGETLAGSGKPLVVTSGTLTLAGNRLGTEDEAPDAGAAGAPRSSSETSALAFASRGVRASVVRLAPSVHGEADHHGFMPFIIKTAREKGVSAFIGDGTNRWPVVHRLDAASLFRLAVEKGGAGARYHGVGDEGVPIREIAHVIGQKLGVPVVGIAPDEAAEHFGFLANFLATDNPTSNALTRERLNWNPTHPGLIADLKQGFYFDN